MKSALKPVIGLPGSAATVTAFSVLLNRWAGDGTIGAKDATVTWRGLEHCVAFLALIEPSTRVGGHRFGLDVAALGAGQRRLQNRCAHFAFAARVDG